jgi:hypothetical protein
MMGVAPDYILVEGQQFSKAKLSLDNHVYKNCAIDNCDIYFSGGQYELLDTHITNSRLILNHPAKGMYNAVQIFKMKSTGRKCHLFTSRASRARLASLARASRATLFGDCHVLCVLDDLDRLKDWVL